MLIASAQQVVLTENKARAEQQIVLPAGSPAQWRTHGSDRVNGALDSVLVEAIARPGTRQVNAATALQPGGQAW